MAEWKRRPSWEKKVEQSMGEGSIANRQMAGLIPPSRVAREKKKGDAGSPDQVLKKLLAGQSSKKYNLLNTKKGEGLMWEWWAKTLSSGRKNCCKGNSFRETLGGRQGGQINSIKEKKWGLKTLLKKERPRTWGKKVSCIKGGVCFALFGLVETVQGKKP